MTAIDVRPEPHPGLAALLDAAHPLTEPDDSGVHVARGEIDGHPVVAFRVEADIGAAGCARVLLGVRAAAADGVPVVGVWHSDAPRPADGIAALDGLGLLAKALVDARVPRLSVVLGPVTGVAALADIVIGPGADAHVGATSEADAIRRVRVLAGLLADRGAVDPAAVRSGQDLRALLPRDEQRAYDVKPLVRAIVDTDAQLLPRFAEVHRDQAPAVVTGLARLGGRTVGVVAANPVRGRLDGPAAAKAAWFVRRCDSLGVALVVLVDAPGTDPGWNGAALLRAFAEAAVPRVTLITRKAYGEAYTALNSRALGATAVYAWDSAECAVLPAKTAARLLRRGELAAAPLAERAGLLARFTAQERAAGGVGRALKLGGVDAVIDPAETGRRIAEAIRTESP